MIAIVLTTFLRPELAKQAVDSILQHWREDYCLLVVAQSPFRHRDRRVHVVEAPFDCGLSAARNLGVAEAAKRGCRHTLITADSIMFTKDTNPCGFDLTEMDLIGFNLVGRPAWEGELLYDPGRGYPFKVVQDTRPLLVKQVEICRNFFIATTRSLAAVRWDENLKLREHEDFFWRYKLAGYRCLWVGRVRGEYVDSKPSEYVKYRNRMYREYEIAVRRKYQ